MKDLRSMYLSEISDDFVALGFPKFRAKQVYSWLSKGVISFDEMSNLPKELREKLKNNYCISSAIISKKLVSAIDGTVKYLFTFDDDTCAEAVVMQYHHGLTMCISTQCGCRMGCKFCATGLQGLERDLTAGEILSQILSASRDLNAKISNIVLMGMGEPLDNFDNVARFINLVTDENGLGIGSRHITLSTCGVADKIMPLCDVNNQINLSISLHAPDDETRRKLMPIDKKFPFDVLLDACRQYINKTNRRVTFEYTLIDGVNDSDQAAERLSKELKGMLCHVNLIPVNSVAGIEQKATERQKVKRFCDILNRNGVTSTVRRTLGADINASCGQLKREEKRG